MSPTDTQGLAAGASYLTLSRYADIALRSFSYRKDDFTAFNSPAPTGDFAKYGYVAWWREALSMLVLVAATLPLLTLAVLAGPSRSMRSSRK